VVNLKKRQNNEKKQVKKSRKRRKIELKLKKQNVRQVKLVQFSRFESCPAKVSRPAGM